mmetsp:Transcript_28218/g.76413  ORF Transcript_28218/g.76413 Transcript_28218/m.76413 type:complete len:334 (-) Transcript_28218:138-1139(-)
MLTPPTSIGARLTPTVWNSAGAWRRGAAPPPAMTDYLSSSAELERKKTARDPAEDGARVDRMVALSAKELGMPSAVTETFDYLADVTATASTTHIFEKPQEMKVVFARLAELQAKLNDQVAGPPALSELIVRLGAPLRNQTAPDAAEVLSLLAKASRQVSFPSAVPEFFEYLGPMATTGVAPDPERLQELLSQLSEQVGAPEALAKFGKDMAAAAKKNGGKLDPAKLSKQVTQLFRKLSMPAFAEIFGKVVSPMLIKGKKPDALALAAVAPSLMKVLPDVETANGLANDVRAKLFKPLTAVYETAVEKLTGSMPESALKAAFKQVLSVARPPA